MLRQAGLQIARLTDVHGGLCGAFGFPEQKIDGDLITGGQLEEIPDEAPGNFNDLHDSRGDLTDADSLRIAVGKEDLDCLRSRGHGFGKRVNGVDADFTDFHGGAAELSETGSFAVRPLAWLWQ
jgi:hypothetical protein